MIFKPFKGPRGPLKGPRGPFKGSRGPFKGSRGHFFGPRQWRHHHPAQSPKPGILKAVWLKMAEGGPSEASLLGGCPFKGPRAPFKGPRGPLKGLKII